MRSSKEVASGYLAQTWNTSESLESFIESYRREIIQEVREAIGNMNCSYHGSHCNTKTSCEVADIVSSGQLADILSLPILTLEDPIDPRAVAAAEDWFPLSAINGHSINDQQRKDLARLIDRHFKDSGKGKA